jgi:hypothetical protein
MLTRDKKKKDRHTFVIDIVEVSRKDVGNGLNAMSAPALERRIDR